jgi:2-amino-4-hydroxy-6-hydroxymethyldihydropteridine diphosphokinase
MSLAVVALGSNLGNRAYYLEQAAQLIEQFVGVIELRSAIIETKAQLAQGDNTPQGDYLNGVLTVRTTLPAREVLIQLLDIERQLGRTRTADRWQPRTIDVDLIAYDNLILHDSQIHIPHPEAHNRRFVIGLLAQIWPDWIHPELSTSAAELAARLPD